MFQGTPSVLSSGDEGFTGFYQVVKIQRLNSYANVHSVILKMEKFGNILMLVKIDWKDVI